MNLEHDTTNITVSESGEVVVEPDILEFWRGQGYTIESVSDVKAIPSSSRDIAHIVCKVETYAYPQGHDNLDIVEDQTVIECCSCEDFKYNRAVDVSETYLKDGNMGVCRHLKKAYREVRAENDDAQDTL
jgi:hypothetical protein